jgi:hypothetical protein
MNRNVKVGLLFLIILLQISMMVGGFYAYEQMSDNYWKLACDYKKLFEETHDLIIDFVFVPNPFAPFIPLALLCLFLTIVLLIDEIRQKDSERAEGERANACMHAMNRFHFLTLREHRLLHKNS